MLACKPSSLWSCVTVASADRGPKAPCNEEGLQATVHGLRAVSRTVQAAFIMCLWGQTTGEGEER